MGLLQGIVLAIVQGLTEFLPVSSSAHLAISAKLLGLEQMPLDFAVVLHFGTLISVIVYFWRDLWGMVCGYLPAAAGSEEDTLARGPGWRLLALLVLATIPAAIAGILLEDKVDAAFGDMRFVGGGLLITALLLTLTSRLNGHKGAAQTGVKEALTVGVLQACALPPGVSRSGCTIVGSLLCGMSRDWAPRFSFLLSVPVILGGAVMEARNMLNGEVSALFNPLVYAVGAIVAAAFGYLAIITVINSVKRGNLLYFAAYCLVVGLATIMAATLFAT